jgi:hypothetical protein
MATPSITDDQILDALVTRLSAIVSTGGEYYNTFTGIVHKNLAAPLEVTAINVRVKSDNLAGTGVSNVGLDDIEMKVNIDIAAVGDDLPNILKFKADILKAIGTDTTLGGLVFDTKYIGYNRYREHLHRHKFGQVTIHLKVLYRRNAWSV